MLCPGDDGVEDDRGAVGGGVLVVSGGEAAPLLEVAEAALDHVAVLVAGGVVADGSAAA